ncbi:MAG: hypothetical protein JXX14_08470 [Deltaproteobacteria bacterium]|nr:hypothetical protein [Deltaproteobacteria bacterium]
MEDIKKRWMEYQLETALQLIELDNADPNDARIDELNRRIRKEQLLTPFMYDMNVSAGKPEA